MCLPRAFVIVSVRDRGLCLMGTLARLPHALTAEAAASEAGTPLFLGARRVCKCCWSSSSPAGTRPHRPQKR